MKNIKLIVITVLMVINSSFVFANNEVIEKDGNTTKIKLLDEEDNNNKIINKNSLNEINKLLENTDVTNNYTIVKGNSSVISSLDDNNSFARIFSMDITSNSPAFKISDSNQNLIELNQASEIKMKQDNEFYYFSIDLDIKNENLSFNSALSIGNNEFQTMGNSILYLSNTNNNELIYNYTIDSSGRFKYTKSYSSTVTEQYNTYYGVRTDKINLKINNYSSTQQMTLQHNNGTATYTPNNFDTQSSSGTYLLYNTLTFPFETYLNGNTRFIPYNGIHMDSSIWGSTGRFYTQGKVLFNSNQVDYTTPKKLPYNFINSINISHDNTKSYFNEKIVAVLKIKKSDIHNYRYLNLYNPSGISKSKTSGFDTVNFTESQKNYYTKLTNSSNGGTYIAYSIHSKNGIDLLNYIDCEHNWVIKKRKDLNTHIIFCDKCEWEYDESHDFKYEYDGIKNNLCLCGCIKNIKHYYNFNSETFDDYEEVLLASSSYIKPNPIKKGYNISGYKKYLKYFENMTNPVFDISSTSVVSNYVEDINDLPELSDYFSSIFEAKYVPIKYKVHFNTSNNLKLPITINLEDYDCFYDVEYNTPLYDYGNYIMEGWSIASNSNIITVSRNDKIKNLTTKENDIINLYPVYDIAYYKFKFSKSNNLNITINNEINDLKCYINTNYNLPNHISLDGYTFKGWSLTLNSNKVDLSPNASIYNYTPKYGEEIILYPVYEANKYIFKFSSYNLMNLPVSTISDQVFYFNQEDFIKNNISIKGFNFKGWSLVATSSNIDFYPNNKILNYTVENNKVYTLFPVYEEVTFSIVYMTKDGAFCNGNKSIIKQYKLSSEASFEMPNVPVINQKYDKNNILVGEEIAVFKNYTDFNNKIYNSLQDVKKIVYNGSNNNEIFYLNYNYIRQFVKKTSSNGGGSSNDSGGSINSGNSISNKSVNEDIKMEQNEILNNNTIIKKDESKYSNSKIKLYRTKKDLIDMINEIYIDWKEQNNISEKKRFDIIDLIKTIYEDFNRSHD